METWGTSPAAARLARRAARRSTGKVAVVTGAKSGPRPRDRRTGSPELGATVRMAVRGREDGERVRAELEAEVPGARLVVDVLDVSSLADVRAYAAGFEGPLHVLVHNAGVMPAEREETAEGHELMLATHVLGPHLLTTPAAAAPGSRGGARDLDLLGRHVRPAPARRRPRSTSAASTARRPATPAPSAPQVVLSELWARASCAATAWSRTPCTPAGRTRPGIATSLPGFQPARPADPAHRRAGRRHGRLARRGRASPGAAAAASGTTAASARRTTPAARARARPTAARSGRPASGSRTEPRA